MSRLHICNTFFEQELEGEKRLSLKKWLTIHPAIAQLQYLPLLYAAPIDRILVSSLPHNPDPRLCLIDSPPDLPIEAWAPSEAISQLSLKYSCPPMTLVRQIQSKSFSFSHSPLPGAELLHNDKEVQLWIEKTKGPKVLKKILGFSGRGHFFVDRSPDMGAFLRREFSQNRPVLGEPWVSRTLDFSSQWEVHEKIELQGVTRFETNDRGVYKATIAGNPLFGWAVDRHLELARDVLKKMQRMGFYGPVGIDAFIYNGDQLQPIVEINARRTMSRVALDIQKKDPHKILRMSFESKKEGGLLPGLFDLNIFLRYLSKNELG